MTTMRARSSVVFSALCASFLWGCGGRSEGSKCVPGASAPCACPGGGTGVQTCNSAGTFESCACGVASLDGGIDGGGDSAADALPDRAVAADARDAANRTDTTDGADASDLTDGRDGTSSDSPISSIRDGGDVATSGQPDGSDSNAPRHDAALLNDAAVIVTVSCGDGVLDPGEQCDDGNLVPRDGCAPTCQVEDGWICPQPGRPCVNVVVCGNGVLSYAEICDDGNTVGGDGCSADCELIEDGWSCTVPGRRCTPKCGDSKRIGGETCDDGNRNGGDGCSGTCQVEPGHDCPVLGKPCVGIACGNGVKEVGEVCDCGTDDHGLPSGCKNVNGFFFGDGSGCSRTCTGEPTCRDSAGRNRACDEICGDGNLGPGEDCDDGNAIDGDGCSASCHVEEGFACETSTYLAATTCSTSAGLCLQLPVTFRDFKPQNEVGGHPDFYWLSANQWCVPNSAGPSKGNDATARCWGIASEDLLNGKPQPGFTKSCQCRFSDWSVGNSVDHIGGQYAESDSPLYGRSDIDAYTENGGPIWSGTMPSYEDASSFNQWFNDDERVNQTYLGMLELPAIGSGVYQYASRTRKLDGGYFPLDVVNPAQRTLCNMWPYWSTKFFPDCRGDQYLLPPRIQAGDCGVNDPIDSGCWLTGLTGTKHDSYFTEEIHYYFVYDGANGISAQFFGDDDLFIYVNGKLVVDLGGVHQQLPGKVTISGDPGVATILEGGCLDDAGNIIGATAGSDDCSPVNSTPPAASTPDDFRNRKVNLGLQTGRVYELAIFGADRHPPESNYQLTLNGFASKGSTCLPRCGDGVAAGGEECDCGDEQFVGVRPAECPGPNDDDTYGGCKTSCTRGPFCGDGKQQPPEQCDLGSSNGDTGLGASGCTFGCMKPHYCGDGIVDTSLEEVCDLGAGNGQPGGVCTADCQYAGPPATGGLGGALGSGGVTSTGRRSGSGGHTRTGGAGGTGGVVGTGGTGGVSSSGGAGGTGGTHTAGNAGAVVSFGNGKAQGALTGYGFVALGSADEITSPTCGPAESEITSSTPCLSVPNWPRPDALCVSGSIPALPPSPTAGDYESNWGIRVGVNASDPSGGVLGQAWSSMRITASGSPTTGLLAVVHKKGDPAAIDYCSPMSSNVSMPFTSFTRTCWDTGSPGAAFASTDVANIDQIGVLIASGSNAITVSDLCITSIAFSK